jgi:uncharacterized membrane protein YfcA
MEILFGTISGFISSMGMGGGTILIYLLTTFSKIDQHIAQGANLVFFIPTCITAIIVNIKNKNINYRLSVPIIITGIIGAIIGAKLSVNMPIKELRRYFGVFLICVSINEIYSLGKEYINNKKTNNKDIKNK